MVSLFRKSKVAAADDTGPNETRRQRTQARSPQPQILISGMWRGFLVHVFGIGPAAFGKPKSKLIHPHSLFAKGVVLTTVMFLMYTAVVVPVQLGFYWDQGPCERAATLEIDLAMDCFFVTQIIYTFFLGHIKKGVYVDDQGLVAEEYLRGAFWFDLVTSIPVSFLDLWILETQCSPSGGGPSADLSGLKIVRALKPLRLLKMVRILRIFRILHVFDMIESLFRPPPLLFRVFRILFMIACLGHACSCAFWLLKLAYSTPDEVADFTEHHGIGPDPALAQKYVLAAYFVNTIFTTVGFGDISATNTAEQIFCVLIMYAGTMVFGILLSEIEMAVSSMRAFPRARGRTMQELMNFLTDKDVSPPLAKDLLAWVEFDLQAKHDESVKAQCLSLFPPHLRGSLVDQLHHDELYNVPLLHAIESSHREQLLVEMWDKMETRSFPRGAVLASSEAATDKLFVVVAGSVQQRMSDGAMLSLLEAGDCFGEFCLVGETLSGGEIGAGVTYEAVKPTLCRIMTKANFDAILQGYPDELRDELHRMGEEHRGRREAIHDDDEEEEDFHIPSHSGSISSPEDPNGSGPGWDDESNGNGSVTAAAAGANRKKRRERRMVLIARWAWVVRRISLWERVTHIRSGPLMERMSQKIRLQSDGYKHVQPPRRLQLVAAAANGRKFSDESETDRKNSVLTDRTGSLSSALYGSTPSDLDSPEAAASVRAGGLHHGHLNSAGSGPGQAGLMAQPGGGSGGIRKLEPVVMNEVKSLDRIREMSREGSREGSVEDWQWVAPGRGPSSGGGERAGEVEGLRGVVAAQAKAMESQAEEMKSLKGQMDNVLRAVQGLTFLIEGTRAGGAGPGGGGQGGGTTVGGGDGEGDRGYQSDTGLHVKGGVRPLKPLPVTKRGDT